VVAVSIPVMRANSAVELSIVHALTPPPTAIKWLITSVFWLGSAGLTVLLVIVGLLVPRLAAVRWTALAGLLTWGVCALLQVFLGPAAGRPPTAALAGVTGPAGSGAFTWLCGAPGASSKPGKSSVAVAQGPVEAPRAPRPRRAGRSSGPGPVSTAVTARGMTVTVAPAGESGAASLSLRNDS